MRSENYEVVWNENIKTYKSFNRIYINSGILIFIARGGTDIKNKYFLEKALNIIDDPRNQIVLSEAVRLEVLPKAIYENRASTTIKFLYLNIQFTTNFIILNTSF